VRTQAYGGGRGWRYIDDVSIRRPAPTTAPEIDRLIQLLAKLPGMGRRSAQRAALALLKKREALMEPLAAALADAAEKIVDCSSCGMLDAQNPCALCQADRDDGLICVVADTADVWALERAGVFKGRYHVLGGLLSALDGVRPEDLRIARLIERARQPATREVILALAATVDGQTTSHYVAERLSAADVSVTRLAQGMPIGGELDSLDEGTLFAALQSRRPS
jgi:recombination protein RecR